MHLAGRKYPWQSPSWLLRAVMSFLGVCLGIMSSIVYRKFIEFQTGFSLEAMRNINDPGAAIKAVYGSIWWKIMGQLSPFASPHLPNTAQHPSIPACSTCSFAFPHIMGLSLPIAYLSSRWNTTFVLFRSYSYFTTIICPCEYSFLMENELFSD